MNKSQSVPVKLCEIDVNPIRKSSSVSDLDELSSKIFYEDFFEGDGPLGINFVNIKGEMVVRSIKKGTVASEYYGLKSEMILVGIGTKDVTRKSFNKKIKMIENEWNQKNTIYLKFKKKIHLEVMQILNKNELLKYYDQFVDLGAKILDDFEYIELEDLIKMNFTADEIERFRKINTEI
jgi:hypothetical protein